MTLQTVKTPRRKYLSLSQHPAQLIVPGFYLAVSRGLLVSLQVGQLDEMVSVKYFFVIAFFFFFFFFFLNFFFLSPSKGEKKKKKKKKKKEERGIMASGNSRVSEKSPMPPASCRPVLPQFDLGKCARRCQKKKKKKKSQPLHMS